MVHNTAIEISRGLVVSGPNVSMAQPLLPNPARPSRSSKGWDRDRADRDGRQRQSMRETETETETET
jgi:hypothetical protein